MGRLSSLAGVLVPFTMSASSAFSVSFFVGQLSSLLNVPPYAVLLTFPVDFIGGAIGGLALGYAADRIGRRPALLVSGLIFSLSVALASATSSLWQLYVAWFFVGFGVNAQNGVAYPVVVELIPRFQGSVGGLMQGLYFIGYMLDSLLYYEFPWWREYFLVVGAAGAVLSVTALLVPETAPSPGGPRLGLRDLDRGLALMTVGLSAVVVGAFMFSVPLLADVPSFITSMGLSEGWLAALSALGFAGFTAAGVASDLAGRPKTAAAFSLAGLASSLALLSLPRGYPALAALSVSFFSSGYFSFTGIWASETYPPELRATGTNLVFLVGRLVGGFSPALAASLYPGSLRVGTALTCLMANVLALGGLPVYFLGLRLRGASGSQAPGGLA